jgi:hypothetical protein
MEDYGLNDLSDLSDLSGGLFGKGGFFSKTLNLVGKAFMLPIKLAAAPLLAVQKVVQLKQAKNAQSKAEAQQKMQDKLDLARTLQAQAEAQKQQAALAQQQGYIPLAQQYYSAAGGYQGQADYQYAVAQKMQEAWPIIAEEQATADAEEVVQQIKLSAAQLAQVKAAQEAGLPEEEVTLVTEEGGEEFTL